MSQPDFPIPANRATAVYANNAEAIGNTPLVRLNRIMPAGVTVLAKVESRNPAFSVKCRIGAAMIADAEQRGDDRQAHRDRGAEGDQEDDDRRQQHIQLPGRALLGVGVDQRAVGGGIGGSVGEVSHCAKRCSRK